MNIGDKVQFIKVIRKYCVLKAKTGQTGVLKNINDDIVEVELSNGELVETTITNIKPYQKKEKYNVTKLTNEELVDRFEMLVAKQWQTTNMKTKVYEKITADIDNIKMELLKRLN